MKRITLCIILSLLYTYSLVFGQELNPLQKKHNRLLLSSPSIQSMFRYGSGIPFSIIEVGYEISIGRRFSILPEGSIAFLSSRSADNGTGLVSDYVLSFLGKASLRKYYNVRRRIKKEKNTLNNAFSYFGPMVYYFSKPFSELGESIAFDKEYSSIGFPICWGVQRNLKHSILFDFTVGVGPAYVLTTSVSQNKGMLGLSGIIKFGFYFYE